MTLVRIFQLYNSMLMIASRQFGSSLDLPSLHNRDLSSTPTITCCMVACPCHLCTTETYPPLPPSYAAWWPVLAISAQQRPILHSHHHMLHGGLSLPSLHNRDLSSTPTITCCMVACPSHLCTTEAYPPLPPSHTAWWPVPAISAQQRPILHSHHHMLHGGLSQPPLHNRDLSATPTITCCMVTCPSHLCTTEIYPPLPITCCMVA